jgi:hypothetical protein
MTPQHILLPVPVAQALLKYLEQRPFIEVNQLVAALTQAPAAQVVEPAPPAKPAAPPAPALVESTPS